MDILTLIQREYHKHQNCIHQIRPAFPISPHIADLKITKRQYDDLVDWATTVAGKPTSEIVTKYYADDLTLVFNGMDSEPELYFLPEQFAQIVSTNNPNNYLEFRRLYSSKLDNRKFPSILELCHREQTSDLVFHTIDMELRVKKLTIDQNDSYTYELYIKEPAHIAKYVEKISHL